MPSSTRLIADCNITDFVGTDSSIFQSTDLSHILTVSKHMALDLYTLCGDYFVALADQQEYYPKVDEIFVLNCIYATIGIGKNQIPYQLHILSPTKQMLHSIDLQFGLNIIGRKSFPNSSSCLRSISREQIQITIDKKVHFRNISKNTKIFVQRSNFQFMKTDPPVIVRINERLCLQIKFMTLGEMSTLLGKCFRSEVTHKKLGAEVSNEKPTSSASKFTEVICSQNKSNMPHFGVEEDKVAGSKESSEVQILNPFG